MRPMPGERKASGEKSGGAAVGAAAGGGGAEQSKMSMDLKIESKDEVKVSPDAPPAPTGS